MCGEHNISTLILANYYMVWYSAILIRLLQIPIHGLTQNLGFSIPFQIYIYDVHSISSSLFFCSPNVMCVYK